MKGGGEGDEGRQTVRCDRVVIIAAHGRPTIFSELKILPPLKIINKYYLKN